MAHMSHRHQALVHFTVPKVPRDKGKDIRSNLVDRGEIVLHGPNQAEHFQRILFNGIDL